MDPLGSDFLHHTFLLTPLSLSSLPSTIDVLAWRWPQPAMADASVLVTLLTLSMDGAAAAGAEAAWWTPRNGQTN